MTTQRLHDGTEMPSLGLGTWKSDPEAVYHAVRAALEAGYRHIDCAAVYENEEEVGRALRDAFAAGDINREDVWITSKLWNDAHAPEHVQPALETSLQKLGLDYLDLYLIHWPVALRKGVGLPRGADDFISPDELPLESTWEAMLASAKTGLAKQVGVSNFNAKKIARIRDATGQTPAVNQIELHPYLQQTQLVESCRELGVAVTAYSPLGSPDSAAMFRRKDDAPLLQNETIAKIAEHQNATPGQVLIAWALARGTSVIPKSVNPGRIEENRKAHEVALTDAHMSMIEALDANQRMVDGSFWSHHEAYSPSALWDE